MINIAHLKTLSSSQSARAKLEEMQSKVTIGSAGRREDVKGDFLPDKRYVWRPTYVVDDKGSFISHSIFRILPTPAVDIENIESNMLNIDDATSYIGLNAVPMLYWMAYRERDTENSIPGGYLRRLSPAMFGEDDNLDKFVKAVKSRYWDAVTRKYNETPEFLAFTKLANRVDAIFVPILVLKDKANPENVGKSFIYQISGKAVKTAMFETALLSEDEFGNALTPVDVLNSGFLNDNCELPGAAVELQLVGEKRGSYTVMKAERSKILIKSPGTILDDIVANGLAKDTDAAMSVLDDAWKKCPSILNVYDKKFRVTGEELLNEFQKTFQYDDEGNFNPRAFSRNASTPVVVPTASVPTPARISIPTPSSASVPEVPLMDLDQMMADIEKQLSN